MSKEAPSKLRWIRRIAISAIVAIAFAIIAFHAAVRFWIYPSDELQPPIASTWITDRNGDTIGGFVGADAQWCRPLPADQISPHLIDAIVAVEDQRFYQHGGVDWQSAGSAVWQDLLALRYRRGASTLTMQLEHLRRPVARSLVTKLVQAIRADQIERQIGKRQIVIEYLNRAPFGGNLTGAGAASWRYFGKPCRELSLGQAALLAGIPQSPLRFRPDRFPQAAMARRLHVLERMLACGMINEDQRKEAAAEPVDAGWKPLPQDTPGEIGLLPTLARLAREFPGQAIATHIDSLIQKQATAAVEDQLNLLMPSHVSAAAVVVLDTPTGHCLAAVSRAIDRPNDAVDLDLTVRPRSSGSTLKPFIYAAAFDAGICTPRTVLDDSPTSFAGYEPGNYDRQFAGPMPAAIALAQSRNVPALAVLSKVRVDRAIEVMQGCGLATLAKTPDRYGLSLAIGGAEVTPMELAEAYATLARGGSAPAPSTPGDSWGEGNFERKTSFDDPIKTHTDPLPGYRQRGPERRILRAETCLLALQCIADADRTRNVYGPAVDLCPAWKTGTSSGHRDAWCAAVTPRRTVVVWLGNPDGSGSDALVGQDAAAPLALRILTLADRVPDGQNFAPPLGFLAPEPVKHSAMESTALVMLSPVDHQKIIADMSLPKSQQRLALRARAHGGDDQLWWFVDGDCIGSCRSGEVLWWDPSATGEHEIRVVDAAGQAAIARVAWAASR
jgi:penicillin-binding protein 1C